MTRPMTDSEVMDLIEALNGDLQDTKDRLKAAEDRITVLQDRLHYHEYTVPHKESQA